LGVRLTTPPRKKVLLRNLKGKQRPTQGCRADDDDEFTNIPAKETLRLFFSKCHFSYELKRLSLWGAGVV
jgi:hypothetical protein